MKKSHLPLLLIAFLSGCSVANPICSDTLIVEEVRGSVKITRAKCQEWKEPAK